MATANKSVGLIYLVLVQVLPLLRMVETVPTISSFNKQPSLHVNAQTSVTLSTIVCSDPDGDHTTLTLASVVPSSPCRNCFSVLWCGANKLSKYCLEYNHGIGSLNYASASHYEITVTCQDGNDPDVTELIHVDVIPNTPPYFVPDVYLVRTTSTTTAAGTVIYTPLGADDDNDTLSYTMTVTPSSSAAHYHIDTATGVITNLVDMRSDCRGDVTFKVKAYDGMNWSREMVIYNTIANANTAPVAMNLQRSSSQGALEVKVPENTTGSFFTLNFIDPDGDPMNYTVTSIDTAAWAQFSLTPSNPPNITIATSLDYETQSLRQARLRISASDGYCSSKDYFVDLIVTDVNEAPVLSHGAGVAVCEGETNFSPGVTITDEDYGDAHTWNNTNWVDRGGYSIDAHTGLISLDRVLDVDQYNLPSIQFKLKLVVTDKGGLGSNTATVLLTVNDCNDNAPYFDGKLNQSRRTFPASECGYGGSVVGQLFATDADSSRNQNNVLTYSGSSGSVVGVDPGGSVILATPLPAGQVVTFMAYVTDHGLDPGPLRSAQPAVISVYFTTCPKTTTPAPTTTPAATTTVGYAHGDNIWWITLAAILGVVFVGVTSCLVWASWATCGRRCQEMSRDCCDLNRKERPKNIQVREQDSPNPITIVTKPTGQAPIAPLEAELFGFWKERYADDDYKIPPKRQDIPTPAT